MGKRRKTVIDKWRYVFHHMDFNVLIILFYFFLWQLLVMIIFQLIKDQLVLSKLGTQLGIQNLVNNLYCQPDSWITSCHWHGRFFFIFFFCSSCFIKACFSHIDWLCRMLFFEASTRIGHHIHFFFFSSLLHLAAFFIYYLLS